MVRPSASSNTRADSRKPRVGDRAPWVAGLVTSGGKPVELRKLRGRQILLHFHPQEHAPPCPVEGYNFLERHDISDLLIFGVDLDSTDNQLPFTQQYGLIFHSLCDSDHRLAQAYGVFPAGDGRQYRSSFLIGRKGGIAHIWVDVDQDQFWREVRDLTTAGHSSARRMSGQP